jgi:catechol 2,3-dioxygenase-like lactoylglutathione lyase family enzyme
MQLEHVNMTVANLDRSVDFYSTLLGASVRWSRRGEEDRDAAHVGDDRFYLALFQAADGHRAPDPAYDNVGFNHFGLVVDDLEEMKRRLALLGITPSSEADYEPGRRLYFFDPDGIEVELVEYDHA